MRLHEATTRRYAKALHEAAREAGAVEPVLTELETLARTVAGDPEVNDVLVRPWMKPEDRRGIAVTLAQKLETSPLVRNFMGLLAQRGRIAYLRDIVAAYRALVDEDLGQARAQVRAPVPLTDEEKQRIGARLQQAVGKRIILEEEQDTTLLGGFVAQVGSLILDASLNHQLERLRARLAGG